MALSVTVSNGAVTYALPSDSLDISIGKAPFQAPLPANTDPILIDLGQFRPAVVITGTLDPGFTTDSVETIPTKRQLEDFVKTSWELTMTLAITFGGVTDSYVGKFVSVIFKADAASEGRWNFVIQMVAVGRS